MIRRAPFIDGSDFVTVSLVKWGCADQGVKRGGIKITVTCSELYYSDELDPQSALADMKPIRQTSFKSKKWRGRINEGCPQDEGEDGDTPWEYKRQHSMGV